MAGGGAPAAPGAWIRRAGMRTAAPGCSTRPLPAMLRLQWVARALARQPCSAGWGGVAAPLPAWCYGAGRLASPAWLAAWWRGGGARPVVQPLLSFLPDPSQGRLGASIFLISSVIISNCGSITGGATLSQKWRTAIWPYLPGIHGFCHQLIIHHDL
ncbi:hypothetical protein VPH35_115697 [Triticum aestivum]